MDTEEWIAQYEKGLVGVGAGGSLEALTLHPAARTLESDELARLILDTTHQARHSVSTQIAGISAEYFGQGPALEVIKQHLPAGVPVGADPDDDDYFANPPE